MMNNRPTLTKRKTGTGTRHYRAACPRFSRCYDFFNNPTGTQPVPAFRVFSVASPVSDNRGFLLVELLIAGAILSVAAAVILGSMTASARAMKHAEMRSRAVNLLQQKTGEVESAGLPRSVSGDFGSSAPGFSWSAHPNLNNCGDNVCPATVTVAWTEHGVAHEVALATMASRKRNYEK